MNFDPNKPCQTRDGRKARIICTDASRRESVVALIRDFDDLERPMMFFPDGKFYETQTTSHDLINVPVEHERTYWLVHWLEGCPSVYEHSPKLTWEDKDEIIAITGPHTVRFKEGEGL